MTKKELTVIQMNDTHGYIQEHWEQSYQGNHSYFYRAGGYPRIAQYLKSVREEKGEVLFLDNGDTFHGTYPVVKSEGEILPDLLNGLSVDAMTAHWDFAYGPEALEKLVAKLNYPMLAINAYEKKNDELIFPPYLITEKQGLKIGIIGIAATIIDKVMPKGFSDGVYFTMGNEELPAYIKELKEEKEVDLIVVLSHLGFPQEIKLAEEVDGIDLLLSGHTHNRLTDPAEINGSIIIQSGCHGSFLGRLDLTVEDKKIIDYQHELVSLSEEVTKDPKMEELVAEKMTPYHERLNQMVGYTETNLHRYGVLESTMDNLLLKSMLDYSGAELAFSNGWRYGAPIPKGPIIENDLWNIIPTNPPVSTTILTGREVWEMMEENLERTFAKDPYQQMGGYVKRSMGLSLYFKFENPYGQRIQELFIGNEKVQMDEEYRAVFVTIQGVPAKYGKKRKETAKDAIEVLRDYIKEREFVSSPLIGNIKGI
ncbi:MAG: bifunctional metallophosphatase/5'-nucleotidase [Atopostipes sp.]|nr:bifunctional metallophosphatase/5'-nucleotidase [Atopostipes sp.]